MTRIIRYLYRAALLPDGAGLADGQLLERFVAQKDEAAFEVLVRRHGAMVLGVCRRVLRNHHDAEDAFQATFLVLVHKAATIIPKENLAHWLYGVACRTAKKARVQSARRQARERHVSMKCEQRTADEDGSSDLGRVLDQELCRLPNKYRIPIILCDLEGKTHAEAARQLGWPPGTLSSRLARAKGMLASRLARRGLAPSAGAIAAALAGNPASATVPPALVATTVKSAILYAARQISAGAISTKVISLTKGVLTSMFLAKVKNTIAIVLLVCAVGVSAMVSGRVLRAQTESSAAGTSQSLTGAGNKAKGSVPERPPQAEETSRPQASEALKEAREAVDAVEDPQWKAWLLHMIGEAQSKSGNKPAAAQTFKDAIRAAKEIKDENQMDSKVRAEQTLSEIASVQAKAGDVSGALQTVETIKDAQIREHAWATVARFQAKGGDVKGALKAAEELPGRWKDYALTEAAAVLAWAGNLAEAERVVRTISDEKERVWPLAELAKAKFKKKDVKAARKTIEATLKIVGRMDEGEKSDSRSFALRTIAGAQADVGDFKDARKTIETIKDATWKDCALGDLVAAQANAGRFTAALETADDVEQGYIRGEALTAVVKAQLRLADLTSAQQTADSIENISWHMKALLEIAQAQAKAQDLAGAAKSLQKAIDKGGVDGKEILDAEPGAAVEGVRNATLALVAKTKFQIGQEQEALAWTRKQASAELRVLAFLKIAQAIELRKAEGRRLQK